jgi:hypothetical protein
MILEPLTDYSRFKAECEKILLRYQSDDFTTSIIGRLLFVVIRKDKDLILL